MKPLKYVYESEALSNYLKAAKVKSTKRRRHYQDNRRLKAAQIELSYIPTVANNLLPKISGPEDSYLVFRANWEKDKLQFVEQFKVMLLTKSNRVLGIFELSTGGTAGTVSDAKLIFASSILSNASSIIVAHNHPSGNLVPSDLDLTTTRELLAAGQVLGIPLLDHLIIGAEGYYSFSENNLI